MATIRSFRTYFRDMELILKTPANKPPFIGILFQKDYEAARLNQNLVNNYKNHQYELIIEPTGSLLNLRLYSEDIPFFYQYLGVSYSSDKLKSWYYNNKSNPEFNFSHLSATNDDLKVVRTLIGNKLFVLKIRKILFYKG